MNPTVVDILGTPLVVTDYDRFTLFCQERVKRGGTISVDLTNTQVVTMRRHEPWFRAITSRVDHFVPDGMPLIWCMRARGASMPDRVYGPAFMRRCILASPKPWKHYFLGGSQTALDALRAKLLSLEPALEIVGMHHGYFSSQDEDGIIAEINRQNPDFIWVGLGTPKQQQWIHQFKQKIRRGVIFAVGFAFDVNAETKRDAPSWMQRFGLTWIFRILSEPRRLLGRYLKYNTLFLFYLAKERLSSR